MCSALGIQRFTGLDPAPSGATLISWPSAAPVLPSEVRAPQRNYTKREVCKDCIEIESSVVEETNRGTKSRGGDREAKCPLSMYLGGDYQKSLKVQTLSSPASCLRERQRSGKVMLKPSSLPSKYV